MQDYRYKTRPYQHQREVFETTRDKRAWGLFLDLGVGKSKVTIDTASYLFGRGAINALLVVAPKGVYANWTTNELPRHMPDSVYDKSTVVLWQSNYKTKKFQEQLSELFRPEPLSMKILVINIEALNTEQGYLTCERFLTAHDSMMVVDESTIIKNGGAKWTKKCLRLARYSDYRRILTGTPVTNSPLDCFTQFQFLDEDILGFSSFYAFRNRYAILRRRQVSTHTFDEVVGYQRLDELHERIRRGATVLKKDDCLDLPPKVYERRFVELSPAQKKAYEQLRTLSIAELEDGGVVTVDLALTKLLRLHQVACGFLPVADDADDISDVVRASGGSLETIRPLDDGGGPRVRELMNLLEEIQGKCIIWATYTHNIRDIENQLTRQYGAGAVGTFYGATSQDERNELVRRFQDPDDELRFFVGQPRTGGYGLTLTAASTVVYFSNNYSLEVRLQSEDRAHRIGQERSVTYVDLVAPGTVDEKIIELLHNKQSLADEVVGEGWKKFLE